MLSFARLCLLRLTLLVTLTVALVATGFAHRMPSAEDQALAFVIATGATSADFCGDGPDGKASNPHCFACQITASADMPSAMARLIDLKLVVIATVFAPRESRAMVRALDPGHGPQGPPAA